MMQQSTDLPGADCWRADALARFDAAYPAKPVTFDHDLASHPLLDRTKLADVAMQLPSACIELRSADTADVFVPRAVTADALAAIFAGAPGDKAWLMLRGLETLPDYRQLIDDILAPIEGIARHRTGRLHQPRAFLFCANADALTPHHFDPEHNILFHLEGPKRFYLRPDAPPYLRVEDHLRLHRCGENLLGAPDLAAIRTFDLQSGTALYVPYKWPHWVEVGDAPSLSLSITWTSDWSLARDAAWRGEAILRRLRLPHVPMPAWPGTARLRTTIGRIADQLR